MAEIRLSKFIADCGVASRRRAEELIEAGRVSVDGKRITVQGSKIDPIKHQVTVDGKSISAKTTKTYIAFHKPRGILSTMSDPENRPCLGDYFSLREERLFHVGRLDKESEGLILLSNDGAWAQQMAHPSFEVVKRYRVLLNQALNSADLKRIKTGVRLEDGMVKVVSVSARENLIDLSIHEGRNQVIRRMMEELGYKVERLLREEFGRIKLGELPAGKWRHLHESETRTH